MKNVNKLASLILATLMLCLSVFGVSAAELIGESLNMIIMGSEGEQEELVPMMANDCPSFEIYCLNNIFEPVGNAISEAEAIRMIGEGKNILIRSSGSQSQVRDYAWWLASQVNECSAKPEQHVSGNGQNQYWHFNVEGGSHVCFEWGC